ncbi:hypothetical protein FEE95_00030 [Maribacter algarum]|uniref:Uncharacterized protein n=1 Tax=Maribacter algarum (ex Zhang et al. 2020) TaxID=2578118 RepID=A0A5S3PX67_9FLAO|nr:hypothetical protein [Maribacter algarum]TMM57857.1 hypothetical protein FEE95_00030 [Maribacter algarum]
MQSLPNPAVNLAIILNAILLVMYIILKNNGEEGSVLFAPVVNPIELFKLARRTKNKGLKWLCFILVLTFPILLILFVIAAYHEMSKFN